VRPCGPRCIVEPRRRAVLGALLTGCCGLFSQGPGTQRFGWKQTGKGLGLGASVAVGVGAVMRVGRTASAPTPQGPQERQHATQARPWPNHQELINKVLRARVVYPPKTWYHEGDLTGFFARWKLIRFPEGTRPQGRKSREVPHHENGMCRLRSLAKGPPGKEGGGPGTGGPAKGGQVRKDCPVAPGNSEGRKDRKRPVRLLMAVVSQASRSSWSAPPPR